MTPHGSRWLAILLTAAGLATWSPAQAEVTCHKINATGEGRLTGPTTTESRIIDGGLIHGTTTSDLLFTSLDPIAGVATYIGTLVLTNEHGTLTFSITDGVYNLVTGEFSNDSTVIGGTERFAG